MARFNGAKEATTFDVFHDDMQGFYLLSCQKCSSCPPTLQGSGKCAMGEKKAGSKGLGARVIGS